MMWSLAWTAFQVYPTILYCYSIPLGIVFFMSIFEKIVDPSMKSGRRMYLCWYWLTYPVHKFIEILFWEYIKDETLMKIREKNIKNLRDRGWIRVLSTMVKILNFLLNTAESNWKILDRRIVGCNLHLKIALWLLWRIDCRGTKVRTRRPVGRNIQIIWENVGSLNWSGICEDF